MIDASNASNTIVGLITALICPPAAVIWKQRGITESFWILAFLCLLLWFPGMLYAIWIVGKQD